IVVLIFWIFKFIAFSYNAAADPSNGFFLSFLGYTLGVGLCEELCKAIPLLLHYRQPSEQSWRGAFLWGLASGAGFGIARASSTPAITTTASLDPARTSSGSSRASLFTLFGPGLLASRSISARS